MMKVAAGTLRLDGGGSRSGSFVPGAAATGGGGDLRSDDGGIAVSFLSREHRLWSGAGRRWQEVERLRPARSFSGDVRSCLADRCYALSCLVGRCYARQILLSLRVWMDEPGEVVPLGAMVASTDGWTDKDYADLSPEDGSTVRGLWRLLKRVHVVYALGLLHRL
ncbi:Serine/threonine-protein kinase HT1 [Hordeum vulgare]|nr:Serine/threonine-protein kinase HT1 [Hordeum vulgare]